MSKVVNTVKTAIQNTHVVYERQNTYDREDDDD